MSARDPELLFHATSPTLYSSNTDDKILTIRFPSPVRISSIRVTPEGVASPSGPGETYPHTWNGEVFLNISPSDPVNALVNSVIEYEGGGWPVDYDIGMPDGVSTRMIAIWAPADIITLSIYGFHAAGPSRSPAASPSSAQTSSIQPVSSESGTIPSGHEDWTWVSDWAGGPNGLITLLGSFVEDDVKRRCLSCLELLEEVVGLRGIKGLLYQDPEAIRYILTSDVESKLSTRLTADYEFIHHTVVAPLLPSTHPLYALIRGSPTTKRSAAWNHLHLGEIALRVLLEAPADDLLETPRGQACSHISRLLSLAEKWAEKGDEGSATHLGLCLDILSGTGTQDRRLAAYLSARLPRLLLAYNLRKGTDRPLGLLVEDAERILQSLLLCSGLSFERGDQDVWPVVAALAQPYLAHLPIDSPLRHCFTQPSTQPTYLPDLNTSDTRRLSRLSSALTLRGSITDPSSPPESSAIIHSATPAELVALLAPRLYAHLATAPVPLLDIPSSLANTTPDSQANAWAGKVYTSHEFRNREEAKVGLGIKGVTAARASRPASRHVDEYVR